MPLYEYECKQCHQRLEKIQSFSAPHETICPKCGGELERVISAPAIQFKGAGWYVNDYAKSGGKTKPSESADGKTESKSESKSEGKSGSASDSKSESGKESGSKTSAASSSDSSSSSSSSASPASSSSGNSGSSSKSE